MAAPAYLKGLGRTLRRIGQSMESFGLALQEREGYVERLVPSTRVVPFKGKEFTYGLQNFVASSASVVGDVAFGELSSAWYGATVRGDRGSVKVGRTSAILDNAVVTATKKAPTVIGDEVVICPGAVVTSATIGDGVMIGMGARVLAGAKVGQDCFIDAGAVVMPGTVIPPGQLWTGAPARHLRNLGPDEMSYLRSTATLYGQLGQRHFEQGAKSPAAVEEDAYWHLYRLEHGMKADAPIPQQDADVIEYYKLTQAGADTGLFRAKEADVAAEGAAREAEELAADNAETEYYKQLARVRRVGEAVRQLAATRADRPAARDGVISGLAGRDPEGAALLRDVLHRVDAAAAGGDAGAKEDVLRLIMRLDPSVTYDSDEHRKTAAAGMFDALAAHAKALAAGGGAGALPAQGAAGGGSRA